MRVTPYRDVLSIDIRCIKGTYILHPFYTHEPMEMQTQAVSLQCHLGTQVRRFHPFGGGMRSCIGQSLARMNAPTVLAMLVSNFRFEMDESVRLSS